MKLRIDRLRIVATTVRGPYGTDITFGDGLNVLRADNSSGKSTLVNAILYGLGMEGMLGPSWPRPLKYALYDELTDQSGVTQSVQESHVMLEISNDRGEHWTLRRQVHGGDASDLVRLWDGRALTQPGTERPRGDTFVRGDGSASREAGFHMQLARFIGWELPDVVAYDGKRRPLYMQLIFPLLFVEQQTGWTGVRDNVPTYLRVRDPALRAVQFLLDLQAVDRAGAREELDARLSAIRQRWASTVGEFRGSLRGEAAVVTGVPETPVTAWPPEPLPTLMVYLDQERVPVAHALAHLRGRLKELRETEIPKVSAVAAQTQLDLTAAERKHREIAAARAQLIRDVAGYEADVQRIKDRQSALRADRKRHLDAQKVLDLGGSPVTRLADGHCPTCDQHWPHDLLGGDVQSVMSFKDNVAIIEQEQRALNALGLGAAETLAEAQAQLVSLSDVWFEAQADVRALREVLLQDGRAPSAAAIRERLVIERRIEGLNDLAADLDALVDRLAPLAKEHRDLKALRDGLADDELTPEDERKVSTWEKSILEQLRAYDFKSTTDGATTGGIRLSRSTLLPEREGLNLAREVSASDTIRLIWSYLLGLLEASQKEQTNHPGLLILDEPGQQDIEDRSVRAFMERASRSAFAGQQVIITITRATSAFMSDQVTMPTIVEFGSERVLRPLAS